MTLYAKHSESLGTTDPGTHKLQVEGATHVNGALTVTGNEGIWKDSPEAKLHITSGRDAKLGLNSGYITLVNEMGQNMAIADNEIKSKRKGTTATILFLQAEVETPKEEATLATKGDTKTKGGEELSGRAGLMQ